MNVDNLIGSLERFRRMLPEVVRDIDAQDAVWKPEDGAWSILEIVSHLADEEEFDFRVRLESTLNAPNAEWPPIDPEGWAVERQYNEGRLSDAVERFSRLRKQSIVWLRSLHQPDWSLAHQHPKFGEFLAGDVFAAWVAHDYLHLRQISKRMYQITARDAGEYSTRYAGPWRE